MKKALIVSNSSGLVTLFLKNDVELLKDNGYSIDVACNREYPDANTDSFFNEYCNEIFIKRKSVYVPNGINDLPISPNTNYLEEIGVEPGKYILSVGRITQEKGFETLIKAYKLAQKNNFKLVIAGGVEFKSSYMKELQKLSEGENVIFTGYTFGDNLHQLYTHAGMYVLASNNEGFPLVLLEAMKYGLDILVSDIPATHLVDLDSNDYFPRGDYKTLATKISERVKASKKKEYDLNKYDWNEVADTMSNIFYKVANCN